MEYLIRDHEDAFKKRQKHPLHHDVRSTGGFIVWQSDRHDRRAVLGNNLRFVLAGFAGTRVTKVIHTPDHCRRTEIFTGHAGGVV